ncbi:MAG: PQQ-binding-like beta-propeller repeat protein [Lacunisphaera sp.]
MRVPLLALALTGVVQLQAAAGRDWPVYLGDKAASHYSTLSQITPQNVGRLEVAWTYHAGEARPDTSQMQCNPLVIDGVIYATTPSLKVVALEAATGRELWRFSPAEPNGVNRGLAWWADGKDRRILFGTGHWLHAIDAATGQLIESFGDHGRVNLSDGLGRDVTGLAIQANTPGIVFHDLIIMGMRVGEGPAPAAPGHLRAYNIRTGQIAWTFHTIPQPDEPGYETWPKDAYQRVGGVNVWTGMTIDEERGLLFAPIGSATFDFWGGDRVGDNLYANCLVALDAATGKKVWHFQFTRHDMWDRDPPAPPALLAVKRDGKEIPAVAQNHQVRPRLRVQPRDGRIAFPAHGGARAGIGSRRRGRGGERAAAAEARGICAAGVHRERNHRPHARGAPRGAEPVCAPAGARAVRAAEPRGYHHPAGLRRRREWGGAAVDPSGVLYVNANEMAWILTMIETGGATTLGEQVYVQNCAGCHGADRKGNPGANIPSLADLGARLNHDQALEVITKGRAVMPPWGFLPLERREAVVEFLLGKKAPAIADPHGSAPAAPSWPTYLGDKKEGTPPPYTHTGYNRFLDPDGYPAIKPPWGTLNAIDLNTGEFLWRVPLGEYPELVAQGIPPTGTENYGGPLVTAGGVLFIGASKDGNFRAFDRATGKELWRMKLPAGGYATPSTYEVGRTPVCRHRLRRRQNGHEERRRLRGFCAAAVKGCGRGR